MCPCSGADFGCLFKRTRDNDSFKVGLGSSPVTERLLTLWFLLRRWPVLVVLRHLWNTRPVFWREQTVLYEGFCHTRKTGYEGLLSNMGSHLFFTHFIWKEMYYFCTFHIFCFSFVWDMLLLRTEGLLLGWESLRIWKELEGLVDGERR